MDNPGTSLFQNGDLNLNKSRNEEEEEDLEDQKRRNAELQNLLMTKLDDFNYDESTVNSSIISAVSCDNQNNYLKAENQQEQLKILYEVRMRENQALKEINEKLMKEIDAAKKKCLLSEAELEQLKFSYKNSDSLLVEKTAALKELTYVLESKEKQIQDYKKNIDNMNLEISTYKTTINDLHLQLQGDRNPIISINKKFNSEEYKAAYQEQIDRLEVLLEEKAKNTKHLEKENNVLKEELNKLINASNDDANLIKALTVNFESAQKQCEELIDVVETLTNENRHLQERVTNLYQNTSGHERQSLDKTNAVQHLEKLKKMLVDKSVQIDTLNIKLRNYEENLKELIEYRKLKSDAYQKEFQQCDNKDHTKNLLLMQNDLQNYRRIIEDKNQQILNLNSTNKDLLAKMEDTLSQTRNDIKNFSNKYSLPQLEQMAEDLKRAEDQITFLEKKLQISQEKTEEIESLKLLFDKERNNFENEIKKLTHELEISSSELKNLKQYIEQIVNENVKLKSTKSDQEEASLKMQYVESITALEEAQRKILTLQETIEDVANQRTIAEGEKCTYEFELKDYKNRLENSKRYIENLEAELENATRELRNKEEVIRNLEEAENANLKSTKSDQEEASIKTQNALEEAQRKILTLQKTIEDLDNQRIVAEGEKCTYEFETKDYKNSLENSKRYLENLKAELENATKELRNKEEAIRNLEEAVISNKEAYKVSIEVKLREEIQEEYSKKLEDIEKKYQNVYTSSKELCQEQKDKLKIQESKFRGHLSVILKECSQKINEYEQDRRELIKHVQMLQNQFDEHKFQSISKENHLKQLIQEIQINNKKEIENCQLWSRKLINSCLKVEAANKTSRDSVALKMQAYNAEVAATEKFYNDKIEKLKSSIKK